jgi:hypothetical protein
VNSVAELLERVPAQQLLLERLQHPRLDFGGSTVCHPSVDAAVPKVRSEVGMNRCLRYRGEQAFSTDEVVNESRQPAGATPEG